jgi:hypothetical protein
MFFSIAAMHLPYRVESRLHPTKPAICRVERAANRS